MRSARPGLLHRAAGAAAARAALGRAQRARWPPSSASADWLRSEQALAGALRQHRRRAAARRWPRVYSGHQFGVWAGQLGDGRALLLGEIDSPLGPAGAAAQGQRPARPTRAWATAAPCCARRSASSCAPRRCTASASRPRARWRHRLAAAGAARDDRDRGRGHARGAELHPLRPLRALRAHAPTTDGTAQAGRLRHRSLLSRVPRRAASRCCALARRGGAAHRAR